MTAGFVVFRLGERVFAAPLDTVREIVRLGTVQPLPGSAPPLTGVVDLRGTPLPVLDVRPHGGGGDALVVDLDGDVVGVAVDAVVSVVDDGALTGATPPSRALPSYVVEVRSDGTRPVLVVDLTRLLAIGRGAHATAAGSATVATTHGPDELLANQTNGLCRNA